MAVKPKIGLALALIIQTSLFFLAALPLRAEDSSQSAEGKSYTLAAYYFPNYHFGDDRNEIFRYKNWNEWELVKNAKPRYPGHQQPKAPLWGYTNEASPDVMAMKIDAAADHGLDVFLFDWYWYDDGAFLNKGLDEGFLKAPNNRRLKFAIMWANHDWLDIFPYKRDSGPQKLLYPGKVKSETFDTVCDFVIQKYFQHPSYWTIDGKPYFSLYEVNDLLKSFGSLEQTRKALDRFREKTRAAGFKDLHLNWVKWGSPVDPATQKNIDPKELIRRLGFDSVTSYVWIHHVPLNDPQTDFLSVQKQYDEYWDRMNAEMEVPYYPNVSMGWDSSPRTNQDDPHGNVGYPFTNFIVNNTPENFEKAFRHVKQKLDRSNAPKIITINSWNEWTEGSYLEPDTQNGFAYLQAIRNVFGPNP